ncbi:helix-turn-helix domain-containing protein [Bacillus sp. SCS-153A]|uniref:helix-turn-helix domain-containing protein n=1 Tax=Rossellomorea sedimentorum TaxID=3115294 RepID=UPI0039059950
MSKQLLNNYENGKSQIPNDILRKMVHLYQVSPIDLYKIISGSTYPEDPADKALVLREKFEDGEMERAMNMLHEYPQLKNLLITASFYDIKKQQKFINKMITIIKTIEE